LNLFPVKKSGKLGAINYLGLYLFDRRGFIKGEVSFMILCFLGHEKWRVMQKTSFILIFSQIVKLISACSIERDASQDTTRTVQVSGGSYQEISITTLETMLEDKNFTFINVHIPFEGDIPGTDLSIPYNRVEEQLALLPSEKDAKIVLYCRSDRMSTIAARTLVEQGYTNVWNVAVVF
jgi:rhodanese-related sulfurtransferase